MNLGFNFDNEKIEALRTIAKLEIGKLTEIEIASPAVSNSRKKGSKDISEDGYTERDEELEKAMYMYQCYPCLRYNIKSYIPLLKKKVIGQDKVLEKLIYVAYFNQYVNFLEEYLEEEICNRQSMLLIAPTGSGKSTMLRALEMAFNVPVVRVNITATTSSGYVGDKVESILLKLIERTKGEIAKAERGIILIDEIDKKITSDTSERDVSGKAVQQELLKFFDRGTISVPVSGKGFKDGSIDFNTGNLTIILAGACVGLDEIRKKRLKTKSKIGFTSSMEEETATMEYTREDLIEYGFIPELIGRIDVIQELEPYTQDKLVDIIYFSDESYMQSHVSILQSLGVENIQIDGMLWEKIAERALGSKLGVRELNNIMGEMFYPIVYEAFQHSSPGSCVIDANGKYILSYKEEKKVYKGICIEIQEKETN